MNNDGLKKLNFNNFLFKNYYSTPSVMVKRSVILKENFSDQMRYSEDFECWRRIKMKLNFYQYILLMVAIVISVLKSFKRLVHYKFN